MSKRTVLSSLVLILLASPVHAGPWAGTETTENGVLHVRNPAAPSDGRTTANLEELWRLGGESAAEEEFFGVIGAVKPGPDGNLYLLDRQLSEVRVFAPDGSYVNTLGREGEGPGEFRRPADLCFTPDGNVAVLQAQPAKLILLTPDGDPVDTLPIGGEEGFGMLLGGQSAGSRLVLATATSHHDAGKMYRTTAVTAYDAAGKAGATYFSQESVLNFARPVIDERTSMTPPWALGPDGTVYVVPDFGEYRIQAFAPDGTLLRVIEREYESLPRSAAEKEDMKKRFIVRGIPQPEVHVTDDEPDISTIVPHPDGSIWVLTSRGEHPEAGALATYDVFDSDGRFVRQITLLGEGDPEEDAVFLYENRVYLATQFRSAIRSMYGAGEEGADDEADPKPMEVICYRMLDANRAQKP